MKHLRITVYGLVQGVYFRNSTKAVADQLGILGTVRNQKDGSVLIHAEGKEARMQQFIKFCNLGPPAARVDQLDAVEEPLQNFERFEVLY